MATLNVNSATGNDSNTYAQVAGGAAWATPGRAFWGSTNQESPDDTESAQPGDTVLIAAGTYVVNRTKTDHYNGTLFPAKAGTSGHEIAFKASGTVILQQTGELGPILGVRSYCVLDGFTVDEANAHIGADSGLIHSSTTYATIQNCTLIGAYDSIAGEDNHSGIRLQTTTGNRIYNNDISGFTGNNGNNDAAICLYGSTDTIIEHNNIYDGVTGVHVKATNNGTIVRYNLFYGNSNKAIRMLQCGDVSSPTKIYQNIIRDEDYVGMEYNASVDGYPEYTHFVNNTLVNIGYYAITLNDGVGTNNLIYNNIIYNADWGIYSTPASNDHYTSNYNCVNNSTYYGRYNSTDYAARADFYAASGWDANGIETDPSFVNYAGSNFKLNAGSPCLGTGYDILNLAGGGVGGAINRGAYITAGQTETIGIESTSAPVRTLFRP